MHTVNPINYYKSHQAAFSAHHKVLIADDEKSVRDLNEAFVKRLIPQDDTCEIRKAATVEEAKQHILEQKPDILLSDGNIHTKPIDPAHKADGLFLGDFAKSNGVKSITIISGNPDIKPFAKEKGFNFLSKGTTIFTEFKTLIPRIIEELKVLK